MNPEGHGASGTPRRRAARAILPALMTGGIHGAKGQADARLEMSITKRYFTSPLSIRSYASLM